MSLGHPPSSPSKERLNQAGKTISFRAQCKIIFIPNRMWNSSSYDPILAFWCLHTLSLLLHYVPSHVVLSPPNVIVVKICESHFLIMMQSKLCFLLFLFKVPLFTMENMILKVCLYMLTCTPDSCGLVSCGLTDVLFFFVFLFFFLVYVDWQFKVSEAKL